MSAHATEDQQMELDMMEAMWGDHFAFVQNPSNPTEPAFKVELGLSPDVPVELRLTISYPRGYPESAACTVAVDSISATRRIQTDALQRELNKVAKESIGSHCGTLILQQAQEFLFEADSKKEKSKDEEVKDPTIRMGNALTKEIFEEWKVKFESEFMAKKIKEKKAELAAKAGKLSGRQLWDSTLRKADWELFDAEEDGEALEDYTFDDAEEEEEGDQIPQRNYDPSEFADE